MLSHDPKLIICCPKVFLSCAPWSYGGFPQLPLSWVTKEKPSAPGCSCRCENSWGVLWCLQWLYCADFQSCVGFLCRFVFYKFQKTKVRFCSERLGKDFTSTFYPIHPQSLVQTLSAGATHQTTCQDSQYCAKLTSVHSDDTPRLRACRGGLRLDSGLWGPAHPPPLISTPTHGERGPFTSSSTHLTHVL